MADAGTISSANGGAAPQGRIFGGSHQPSEGRGRGRGQRGPRGGRGRGRAPGRGPISNQNPTVSEASPEDSPGRPPGGFGARLTGAAAQIQDDVKVTEDKDNQENAVEDDGEVCFICASPIEHISIAPCNHQTCHICSLRMRALYKTRACAHCRVSSTQHPHQT